ncbi:class I SAM-dependent methyltransferase [Crossiella cryophila]|uniref:Ubiquinone/menaquinone biosynthesis C-methylase UbiE n=1 Tax=Crossiella cryophila TaxID=43355 RepID=A0A7W7CEN1_9PSEU|nr:methyltransferase domain-containing protein [Crossiella cryophila]MBB4678139.1 ubiquinone/menaquinone biosynthesis C-methylase UbiE [Crossiella cryophila]
MVIRGASGVTAETVGAYYDQITEFVAGDLGGSLHIGYWKDLPPGSSVRDASRRMTALMIEKVEVRPGQRVLDIGCGTGRPAVDLAKAAGVEVVGVNVSRLQLERAGQLAAEEGLADRVRFQFADAMALPFGPGSFDGVWLFESLFHMPDQRQVLCQIAEVLRPGGRLVIADLVQLVPLTDEQNAVLQSCWTSGNVAAIHPVENYPALLAECGLEFAELTDISDDSLRQTFRALQEENEDWIEGMQLEDLPVDYGADVDNGMARLAVTPEIGYAIVVATKR